MESELNKMWWFWSSFKNVLLLYLQPIHDLRLSPLKRSLLGSISDSGTMVLWDANTQKEINVFDSSHKAPGSGLVFSPASELLVVSVGLDKKIICYDTVSKMWDLWPELSICVCSRKHTQIDLCVHRKLPIQTSTFIRCVLCLQRSEVHPGGESTHLCGFHSGWYWSRSGIHSGEDLPLWPEELQHTHSDHCGT